MADGSNESEEGQVSLKSWIEQMNEENQMEEDANAVLGGSDDDRCTFPDGYVGRQALYSCLTCLKAKREALARGANGSVFENGTTDEGKEKIINDGDVGFHGHDDKAEEGGNDGDKPQNVYGDDGDKAQNVDGNDGDKPQNVDGNDGDKAQNVDGNDGECRVTEDLGSEDDGMLAGVCLACSLHCHEGHELVELYTKRNFQCDCGNSKFPEDIQCKLCPDKPPSNDLNHYNHNFLGLYCTCKRPYPDPDLEEEREEEDMIQCVLCEDWHHAKHLSESLSVDSGDFEELVCNTCMSKCPFLWAYVPLCSAYCEEGIFPRKEQKDENGRVKGKDEEEVVVDETEKTADCPLKNLPAEFPFSICSHLPTESTAKICSTNDPTSTPTASTTTATNSLATTTSTNKSPVYWPPNWRSFLCKCPSCLSLYKEKQVGYLVEAGDSIWEYEEVGKRRRDAVIEKSLSRLNHVQKIELMHGITDFKVNLKNYLNKFAEDGKVVKQEDIKDFFEMQSRKKRKVSSSSSSSNQYFCK